MCNDIVVANDGTAYVTNPLPATSCASSPARRNSRSGRMTRDGMCQANRNWTASPFSPTGRSSPTSSKATGYIALRSTPTAARERSPSCKPRVRFTTPTGCGGSVPISFLMVEGETEGFLDLITIDGDNAKIETVKDGFDGPVSLVQVGEHDLRAGCALEVSPWRRGKKEDPAATVQGVRSQSAAVALNSSRCGPTVDRTGLREFNLLATQQVGLQIKF